MKKSLIFLAFAMIVMAGCSKKNDPFNDPPVITVKDSLVFTLSNETTPAWIFNDNRVEVGENDVCLELLSPVGRKYFYFNSKGETKVFKGEEYHYAIEEGCNFVIYPVVNVSSITGGPYWYYASCIPDTPIEGVTEKNKHYTINFKVVIDVPSEL